MRMRRQQEWNGMEQKTVNISAWGFQGGGKSRKIDIDIYLRDEIEFYSIE